MYWCFLLDYYLFERKKITTALITSFNSLSVMGSWHRLALFNAYLAKGGHCLVLSLLGTTKCVVVTTDALYLQYYCYWLPENYTPWTM
jgi:hypothetical protein